MGRSRGFLRRLRCGARARGRYEKLWLGELLMTGGHDCRLRLLEWLLRWQRERPLEHQSPLVGRQRITTLAAGRIVCHLGSWPQLTRQRRMRLVRPEAQDPRVAGLAGALFDAGLPHWLARYAIIGE